MPTVRPVQGLFTGARIAKARALGEHLSLSRPATFPLYITLNRPWLDAPARAAVLPLQCHRTQADLACKQADEAAWLRVATLQRQQDDVRTYGQRRDSLVFPGQQLPGDPQPRLFPADAWPVLGRGPQVVIPDKSSSRLNSTSCTWPICGGVPSHWPRPSPNALLKLTHRLWSASTWRVLRVIRMANPFLGTADSRGVQPAFRGGRPGWMASGHCACYCTLRGPSTECAIARPGQVEGGE